MENTPAAPSADRLQVRRTADGFPTLYVPALDEHYHSHHGARQESEHVFLRHGLAPLLNLAGGAPRRAPLYILEIGLGTGLNALLTLEACRAAATSVTYTALETVPLPPAVVEALAGEYYPAARSAPDQPLPPAAPADRERMEFGEAFRRLHAAPWNQKSELDRDFYLTKWLAPLETARLVPPDDEVGAPAPGVALLTRAHYHLIYFDAFAPEKQPELWTEAVFAQLYEAAAPGAVLVTYCAQGQFRRNLRAAGWHTEKLPGPPGKREMTRATKAA